MMLVRADQSAVIGINPSRKAEQETGRSVGARVVGSGWEGLHGRPICIKLRKEEVKRSKGEPLEVIESKET